MSKNTAVKLPLPSPANPILLKALGSLDLELEAELTRYRRLKVFQKGFQKGALARSYLQEEITPDLSITEKMVAGKSSGTEESNLDPFLAINPANASLVYQPSDLVPENESQVPPPDDYLESSTRLLQSLAEEETFIAGDEKLLEGVLTPLSITSMLMLLVAGTLVGSVVLTSWKLEQLAFNGNNSSKEENLLATGEPEELPLPYLVGSNPAGDEFINLNLASLPTLEPSPSNTLSESKDGLVPNAPNTMESSVAPTSKPTLRVGSGNLTHALLPPDLSLDFYHVLTPYTGDHSLELAQELVQDAYIRQLSQGKWIQMGAFNTRVDADKFVEQLREKGIFASVYP